MFELLKKAQSKLKNDKLSISIDTDTEDYLFDHVSNYGTENELLEKFINCDEYEDFEQQVKTYLRSL